MVLSLARAWAWHTLGVCALIWFPRAYIVQGVTYPLKPWLTPPTVQWSLDYTKEYHDLLRSLKFLQTHALVPITSSFLLSRPYLDRPFWIHGGHAQGIRPGFWALNHQGLVGRILRVKGNISEVLPLTHESFRLPITLSKQNVHAIYMGHNTSQGTLSYFDTPLETVLDNQTVVSSGHGIYGWPGIPVGVIQKQKIHLCVDFQALSYVHIIGDPTLEIPPKPASYL